MANKSVKRLAERVRAQDAELRKNFADKSSKLTSDSFQSFLAGLGIGVDALSTSSSYGFNPVTRIRQTLEWIHRGSWLGGVAIDVVADDMTRAGISLGVDIDPEDIEHLDRAAVTWNIWNDINSVIKWARLYGGCIGVLMIKGQDPSTPYRPETVGRDMFKGLLVLDRWMVEPSLENLVKEMGPDMGLPKFYNVTADAPALPRMKVHYSRIFRLEGIKLPYWQRIAENLWGLSVIERLYDRMVAFDSTTTGAAQLVYKAYLRTYGIKNLRSILSTGGPGEQALLKQVAFMRATQSNEGITLVDSEDTFEGLQYTFGGLSDILLQFGQQLAGALQIPLVRLFGQSPAGLNSTGESDLRTYYDGIKQQQEATLRVPVTKIYRALAASEGIKLSEGFIVNFNPLWQLTETEKADVAEKVEGLVDNAFASGTIGRKTALEELRQSSRLTGYFSNITDEDIEEAEEELPPALEEAMGMAAGGPQSATEALLGPKQSQDAGRFEESKHKRAGKGQRSGKSKGGQFVSKGGGSASAAASRGGSQAGQTQQPSAKMLALRKRLEGL
jgi:phage-related protein (TIGR01555 family)